MFIIVFSLSNKITLKIKGPGIKNIFSRSFSNNKYPQKIYINEQIQTDITYHYNFTKAKNTVLLIWENIIYDFIEMFNKSHDIIEMDLSNFDSSEIRDMNYMFASCTSLTSINLSNLKLKILNIYIVCLEGVLL